jgi:hypothetical protein
VTSSWRNNCFKIVLSLIVVIGFAFPAHGATWWRVRAKNTTGSAKTSLVVKYTGTGGTLSNGNIWSNGGPGNITSILASSDSTKVTWGAPGLANDSSVAFFFKSDNSAAATTGTWYPGPVSGTVTLESIPPPYDVPSLGTFGIIGLILILVLAGVVVLRKRRLQRAG